MHQKHVVTAAGEDVVYLDLTRNIPVHIGEQPIPIPKIIGRHWDDTDGVRDAQRINQLLHRKEIFLLKGGQLSSKGT